MDRLSQKKTKKNQKHSLTDGLQNLSAAVSKAYQSILSHQHDEGCWCFELEADCTIPAEYILMMHFMDEIDTDLQEKLARYLRRKQCEHGGWPLYYGGNFDISCSVKAYYALKLAGDKPSEPHMLRAKKAILEHGGAIESNVFTRITLYFFNQIPKQSIPFMPVEVMLLPKWFPVHTSKISYWSRTVTIPLVMLYSLKARAKNPTKTHVRELFLTPPEQQKKFFQARSHLNRIFLTLDKFARSFEDFIPKFLTKIALERAEKWCVERLNGEHGLGAIFPAKVNVYQAFACLGYKSEHPFMQQTQKALQGLLIYKDDEAYCQPCVSPVWDTAITLLAIQEAGIDEIPSEAMIKACDWLKAKQLLNTYGDWCEKRPNLEGGGWPFQFGNDHYPDLDDTAMVAWAMDNMQMPTEYGHSIERAANWLNGMQSRNGGFAAFDVDNTYYYLNEIPFADHGALLDPPSVDVSARCYGLLARLEKADYKLTVKRCYKYLLREQEEDGSWFGRWGTNYIYGTWSVLAALEQAGKKSSLKQIQKSIEWIYEQQNTDGGWGEDNGSYYNNLEHENTDAPSTAFQTAIACLALMAAGVGADSKSLKAGIKFLLEHQLEDGLWDEPWFTAPGFPRVFYLKYHGYSRYFPLWAIARYRNLCL